MRGIALEGREFPRSLLQNCGNDVLQKFLYKFHVVRQRVERDLRLDHPELRQVPAGLRFLGSKGRAEDVDLSERHRACLAVELARLGEVRLSEVEIVRLEERACPLAGGGGKNGSIQKNESPP